MAFAGGMKMTRIRGASRTGNVGVRTLSKSTPFTGNTVARNRGRTPSLFGRGRRR